MPIKSTSEFVAQYSSLLKNLPVAVVVHGPDTRILFSNPVASELLGLSEDDLLGRAANDPEWHFVDENGSRLPVESYPVSRVLASHERLVNMLAGIYRPRTRDHVWVWVNAFPEFDAQGSVNRVVVSFVNVTQLQRTEEALRKREAHLRGLLDALPDMVFRIDQEGVLLEYHGPSDKPLMSPDLIPGTRMVDTPLPEDVRESILRAVRAAILTGQLQQVEYEINAANGIFAFEAFISRSGAREAVAVVRDVTKRKRAETLLRQESAFRQAVIEHAAVGLCVYHDVEELPFMRFAIWNERMHEITGYTMEEMNRLGWYQAVYPDIAVRERVIARMRRMREKQNLLAEEWEITRKDGQRRTLAVSTSGVSLEARQPYTLVLMSDITDRKRIEDALRESAETKAVLLREVNHRVKNTLSAFISMLHREYDRASANSLGDVLPILEDLVAHVRAVLTVHTLLSHVGWRPISLSELADRLLRTVAEGGAYGPSLSWQVTPSRFVVDSDQAHHLALVINELVTNSVKHVLRTQGTLQLKLSIEVVDNGASLTFRDDGPGFPASALARGSARMSTGFELVRGIVTRSLRGSVAFRNDNGAVVVVSFPATKQPPHKDG